MNDSCHAFSTAIFRDVCSETISALMPLELADEEEKHFSIEVCSTEISIRIFCRYEDAPSGSMKAR
jgi:hypothetical protein